MSDQNNSSVPKTVPLKMTSSIPLKKETIRVSVKADPMMPASDTATPPPLPGATITQPPAIKTVQLGSGPTSATSVPTPTKLTPDAPHIPAVKTVPLTNSGAVQVPTSIASNTSSSTTPLAAAPPAPSAPKAPQPIKTVPLTNSGSVIVSSAGSSSKGAAVKTVPLASAPPVPVAPSAPAPPSPSSGPILKTQALNAPVAIPAGLKTQEIASPQPPTTPSAPVATSAMATSPAATQARNTRAARNGTSFATQEEEENPNKGWPLAAVALVLATASLVAHILGFTAWN